MIAGLGRSEVVRRSSAGRPKPAGDVVRTVALEPTLSNVAVLGLLVLVRTFLSWTLAVEIEGRWPWQRPEPQGRADQARA